MYINPLTQALKQKKQNKETIKLIILLRKDGEFRTSVIHVGGKKRVSNIYSHYVIILLESGKSSYNNINREL
jgi:hypothetical protein